MKTCVRIAAWLAMGCVCVLGGMKGAELAIPVTDRMEALVRRNCQWRAEPRLTAGEWEERRGRKAPEFGMEEPGGAKWYPVTKGTLVWRGPDDREARIECGSMTFGQAVENMKWKMEAKP